MTFEVIIITYNQENTISRAVESVINQTRKPNTISVYDDCSKDSTVNIIESKLKGSDIHFNIKTHVINLGIFKNVSYAFENATQDVVCVLAGDDAYDLYLLENLEKFIINNSIDLSKDIWIIPNVELLDEKYNNIGYLYHSQLNKYSPFEYVLAGRILSFEIGLSLSAAKKSVVNSGLGYQADLLKSLGLIKTSFIYFPNFIGYKYTVGVGVTNSTKSENIALSKIICLNKLILDYKDRITSRELNQINFELAKAHIILCKSIVYYVRLLFMSLKYLFYYNGLYSVRQLIYPLLPSIIFLLYKKIKNIR